MSPLRYLWTHEAPEDAENPVQWLLTRVAITAAIGGFLGAMILAPLIAILVSSLQTHQQCLLTREGRTQGNARVLSQKASQFSQAKLDRDLAEVIPAGAVRRVILSHADYLTKITAGGQPTAAQTRLFGTTEPGEYQSLHTLPVPEC